MGKAVNFGAENMVYPLKIYVLYFLFVLHILLKIIFMIQGVVLMHVNLAKVVFAIFDINQIKDKLEWNLKPPDETRVLP